MRLYDFEYDGLRLQDFGMALCRFDGGGIDTVNLPEITFNTISTQNGVKHKLASVEYEDCLTFTLQICKNLCDGVSMELSLEDMRDFYRWLNRKEFHKFRPIDYDGEYSGISCNASFNISKIEMDGKLIGLELEAITDSPFMYKEPVTININITEENEVNTIYSKSDLSGHIYPDMEITIEQDGDLEIYNATENRTMRIANCVKDEIITLNYPMITSSLPSHNVLNDFNWIFFRLATSFKNRLNEITVSIPCSIKMTYSPIVKVGI